MVDRLCKSVLETCPKEIFEVLGKHESFWEGY